MRETAISGEYFGSKWKGKVSDGEAIIIDKLMNGYVLIASSDTPNVTIASNLDQSIMSKRVFNSMCDKWLLSQQLGPPFNYVLTPRAKEYYNELVKKSKQL